jgi:vanillate O-demethylase monooxygenase subunit
MRANYQLVIDNLLDLSHTSFVHEGLLGNGGMTASDIHCETEGDHVTVNRHASRVPAPGMFAQLWPGHPPEVDSFTHMRWMAPSNLRLMTGVCEPGADPASGTGYHGCHMLTPASAGLTHYFFTAVRFGVRTTDPDVNRSLQAKIAELRRFAFQEQDAPIIEAQQAVLDAARRRLEPAFFDIDAGPVRYQRVLARLLAEEAGGRG